MNSTWQQTFVQVGGADFRVTRSGGDHPALVLAHGLSDSGLCWLRLAEDLVADYDVILVDQRGHGQSARVVPGESFDMTEDLVGIVKALGVTSPFIGGHSMGAGVASSVAARYPDFMRALILEDPAWLDADPNQPNPMADGHASWKAQIRDVYQKMSLEDLKALCHKESPTWDEAELGPWAESKQQMDVNFFGSLNSLAETMGWRKTAAAIQVPTLLFTGDPAKGSIITAEKAAEAQRLNPLIEVVHLNAGHNIRREDYAAYLKALKGFLSRVS